MKVDIFQLPPAITIGQGDDAFTIQLKRFDDGDRFAVCDGSGMGWTAMARAVEPLVFSWSNVLKPDGSPIPLESMGEDGAPRRNFSSAIGAMPFRTQVETYAAILAVMGLKREAYALKRSLMNQDAEGMDINPTSPPAASTPPTA